MLVPKLPVLLFIEKQVDTRCTYKHTPSVLNTGSKLQEWQKTESHLKLTKCCKRERMSEWVSVCVWSVWCMCAYVRVCVCVCVWKILRLKISSQRRIVCLVQLVGSPARSKKSLRFPVDEVLTWVVFSFCSHVQTVCFRFHMRVCNKIQRLRLSLFSFKILCFFPC